MNGSYEEDGEPRELCDIEPLTVVALRDERGYYQMDFALLEHPDDGAKELLGTLISYLSGSLIPESEEERAARVSHIIEIVSV